MKAGPGMIDMASLTRFERVLLGSDGTVTHLLEAYVGEPIEVVKLFQESEVCDDGDAPLLLSAGGTVLRRRVLLRGSRSKDSYLYAEAVVAVGRMEPAFLAGLHGTEKAIGALLAEARTETFRELLRADRAPAGACGVHFGVGRDAELMSRTYRIVSGGHPIILITEWLPPLVFGERPA